MAEQQSGLARFGQGLAGFLADFAGGYATKDPQYGLKRRKYLQEQGLAEEERAYVKRQREIQEENRVRNEEFLKSRPLERPEKYSPTDEPVNYQPEGTEPIYLQDYKPANIGPTAREILQQKGLFGEHIPEEITSRWGLPKVPGKLQEIDPTKDLYQEGVRIREGVPAAGKEFAPQAQALVHPKTSERKWFDMNTKEGIKAAQREGFIPYVKPEGITGTVGVGEGGKPGITGVTGDWETLKREFGEQPQTEQPPTPVPVPPSVSTTPERRRLTIPPLTFGQPPSQPTPAPPKGGVLPWTKKESKYPHTKAEMEEHEKFKAGLEKTPKPIDIEKMFYDYNISRVKAPSDPIRLQMVQTLKQMGIDVPLTLPEMSRSQFENYIKTGVVPKETPNIQKRYDQATEAIKQQPKRTEEIKKQYKDMTGKDYK